ncbi:MAG: hypothetical protein COA78_11665 [Blastopirellula sp.]|nr:MAG: hypothetical protein COA78_11665 [Blastopirellula sp.]
MSSNIDQLDMSPFPTMNWDDCEWWEGDISLAFGKDTGLTVTPHDPSVSRLPSEAQRDALRYHLEHGEHIVSAVLDAFQPYYSEMRPRYVEFLGDEVDQLMPPISTRDQLRELIDLRQVHIHPWMKSGIGYVGLQFGCTWDLEHGVGVLLHLARVVDIGGADVSFAWAPEEADDLR